MKNLLASDAGYKTKSEPLRAGVGMRDSPVSRELHLRVVKETTGIARTSTLKHARGRRIRPYDKLVDYLYEVTQLASYERPEVRERILADVEQTIEVISEVVKDFAADARKARSA